ncbi:MAG: LysR family transcriptional regulator, partial [Sphingopyxis sp.]|nr:LysR family transcriptional regulator [Sphingopyxis sp.]
MIGNRSLDIEAVAAFLNASEFRSFTRAAQALGTTQSLVSTRVKRLEAMLGHAL